MIDEGGKRMAKIKKVLNSSVVLVEDEQKSDFIILGKGIGYGKKSGENIDVNDSTYQFYIPVVSDKSKQIMDLLDAISPEVLEVTHQVISLAKADLHTEFNDKLNTKNHIIRINTVFKDYSSIKKAIILPRIYHD